MLSDFKNFPKVLPADKISDFKLTEATDEDWDDALKPLQAGTVLRANVSQSQLYPLLPVYADAASFQAAHPSAGAAHIVLEDGATADSVTSLRKRCVCLLYTSDAADE